jgi:cell division protein FtsL
MASFAPATARAYSPAKPRRDPAPQPRPSARPRPQSRPRAKARPRVAGGVLWIVVVAALLAGIVALNVAVLRLNMKVEQLEGKRDRLVSQREDLQSQLSTAAAAGRIEEVATRTLGLGPPDSTTYLELGHSGR